MIGALQIAIYALMGMKKKGKKKRKLQTPGGQEIELEREYSGFRLVTEVMFSARDGLFFVIFGMIWVVAGLVGTGVVDIGAQWIAPGGKAAVIPAGRSITQSAIFVG